MTVDRLVPGLTEKLMDARLNLAAYVQLLKAKGYMSVSESNQLRDNLFKLSTEIRSLADNYPSMKDPDDLEILTRAEGTLSSAAVCLMSGHHDCPTYISVNAEKLERCLNALTCCIEGLEHTPLAEA
ncbi:MULTISPECIES: biofilm formation regulator BssR [unclassified Enterobacter]|uniref:biofilm formation regulator BssR n=1 Tax=unclassified Enterobacter TaxID=2608935 RepID=UPI0008EF37EF|nr:MULTISPECIES: biofilm formation regulator BssR [unclassified Enterobacter]SFQ96235.1 Biofilm formation protein (YliH/bssR) [Enterobacter sp. kpr-6]